MDPAIKSGFAIGFAVVGLAAGFFMWREGVFRLPESLRSNPPAAASGSPGQPAPAERADATPPGSPAPAPKPEAPDAKAPQPVVPGPRVVEQPQGGAPTSGPDVAAVKPAAPGADKAEGPPPPGSPAAKGAFDVVRVEPTGDMVVAGRCVAGCAVELTANGKTQDKAVADAQGHFAMTPPALPPGDHQLALKVTTPDGAAAVSEQTVTVSVPQPPSRDVVVVLNDPDAPSKILQTPAPAKISPEVAARTADQPRPAPLQKLSIVAVDAEAGRFFAQGTAPAGARLRIYLNNALVAEPTASPDGRWSLKIEKGLSDGDYAIRIDELKGSDATVAARAEAKFTLEREVAAATPKSGAASSGAVSGLPRTGQSAPPRPELPAAAAAAPRKPVDENGAVPSTQADAARSAGASADASPPQTAARSDDARQGERSRADAPGSGDGGSAGQGVASSSSNAAERQPGRPMLPPAPNADTGREIPPHSAPPLNAEAGGSVAPPSAAADVQTAWRADKDVESAAAPTTPPTPDVSNPVISAVETVKVRRGDSLWRISRGLYGAGHRYTVLFEANDGQIRNPDLIYPDQVLVAPTGASGDGGRRP